VPTAVSPQTVTMREADGTEPTVGRPIYEELSSGKVVIERDVAARLNLNTIPPAQLARIGVRGRVIFKDGMGIRPRAPGPAMPAAAVPPSRWQGMLAGLVGALLFFSQTDVANANNRVNVANAGRPSIPTAVVPTLEPSIVGVAGPGRATAQAKLPVSLAELEGNPQWLREAVRKVLFTYVSGRPTPENVAEAISAVRELVGERYGLQAGLEDGALFVRDEKGEAWLMKPEGRVAMLYDCFDATWAAWQVADELGLQPEIYVGETNDFTRDVFLQVTLEGRIYRLSMVPTKKAVEEVGPDRVSQWRGIQRIPRNVAQQIAAMRMTAVGFSQLRPLAVEEREEGYLVTLGGLRFDGEEVAEFLVVQRLVSGSTVKDLSFHQARVPLRAAQLRDQGSSELGDLLRGTRKEQVRGELEAALRGVSGAELTLSGEPGGAWFLAKMLQVPVDLKRPFAPSRMPLPPTTGEAAVTSDDSNVSPAQLAWFRRELQKVLSRNVVVIPGTLLKERGQEVRPVLEAIPIEAARNLRVLVSETDFAMAAAGLEQVNPAIQVVSERELAGTVPAFARVTLLGVDERAREGAALVRRLRDLLPRRSVVALPLAAGLEAFVEGLSRALGLADQTVERIKRERWSDVFAGRALRQGA